MPLAVDPDAPGFVCDVPEELPAEFVEPEFGKLEFVEPEFVEPKFVVIGSDPGFAVAGLEPEFEGSGFVEPPFPGACRTETRWAYFQDCSSYSGSPSKATCWCQR